MPGRARFSGGSLLGAVEPLPDVDPEPVEQGPALQPVPAADTVRGRQGPPSTLRITDAAGEALWAAYLVAKTADPFLSFRQFASAVVLDGLGRATQREKRRR